MCCRDRDAPRSRTTAMSSSAFPSPDSQQPSPHIRQTSADGRLLRSPDNTAREGERGRVDRKRYSPWRCLIRLITSFLTGLPQFLPLSLGYWRVDARQSRKLNQYQDDENRKTRCEEPGETHYSVTSFNTMSTPFRRISHHQRISRRHSATH